MVMNAAGAAGTTSTGAPPPNPAANGGTPPPPATGQPWYGALTGEERGFVESKGYQDLASMVKSHRSLETLMGAPKERILKLPEKSDSPEWNDIYTRLGRPEKADNYDLPVPAGQPKEFADFAKDVFHKVGLSKTQGQAVATAWNEHIAKVNDGLSTKAAEKAATELTALKTEWGQAYEQNVAIANKVAGKLGITQEQYVAYEKVLGVNAWTKVLHGIVGTLGVTVDEAEFRAGDSGGNSFGNAKLTPAQAQEQLNKLQKDSEWVNRYMKGGVEEREQFHKLHIAIFPGHTEI